MLSDLLSVNSLPTRAVAYDCNAKLLDVELRFEGRDVAEAFAL